VRGAQRYARMFERLRVRGEGAFTPFLVLGDPDPETSLDLIRALVRGGADALELGLPFSDPVADGPVIQAASARALARGVRTADAWAVLAQARAEHPDLPIGLLVYANLVLHGGADRFYRAAAGAGADSVLIADLPVHEAHHVADAARSHGLARILIAPPNADEARLARIATMSEGYVYVTSRPGVTGADRDLHQDSRRLLVRLGELGSPPALLGFGIASPAHVRQAIALGAAGAISGSAVVRHIAAAPDGTDLAGTLERFARTMKAATM
jgi:tryptophan synthase alpha chain